MTARVPRIGRLASLLALLAAAGCAPTPEYNPQPFHAEADALTGVAQLTAPTAVNGFDRAGQARLSPDGKWVVFRGIPLGTAHVADRDYGLFVARVRWAVDRGTTAAVDPDGRHVVGLDRPIRITRTGLRCGGACFSPDGFTLVFAADADPAAARPRMQLFRADNWEQAVAMTDVARGVDLAQHPIPQAFGASVDECDWSPDGRGICFAATREGGAAPSLYVMRPDGSHVTRLGPAIGYARGPAYSPDGKRIVYRTGTAGAESQVAVADVVPDLAGDTIGLRDERRLTHEAGVACTGPCWMPGGYRIVYATTRHGDQNPELYVMNADGNRKTRLTMSPGRDLLPAVSGDGRHLIWTATRPPEAAPQLFAADLTLPPGS